MVYYQAESFLRVDATAHGKKISLQHDGEYILKACSLWAFSCFPNSLNLSVKWNFSQLNIWKICGNQKHGLYSKRLAFCIDLFLKAPFMGIDVSTLLLIDDVQSFHLPPIPMCSCTQRTHKVLALITNCIRLQKIQPPQN